MVEEMHQDDHGEHLLGNDEHTHDKEEREQDEHSQDEQGEDNHGKDEHPVIFCYW